MPWTAPCIPTPRSPDSSPPAMSSILVIDDEAAFLENTAETLRRHGYRTYEALDGSRGTELARRHLPDLVLCDIHMRPMDGYDTLDALRRAPETAQIPFIFMTGMGDPETLRKGMDRGADDFLPKPFTPPQLCSAVDTRLRKHAELRSAAEQKLAHLRASLTQSLPHEFITPLNGIYGLGQLLSSEASNLSAAEIGEFGRDIVLSAERLQRTVQNFLLYGQLEMEGTEPARVASRRRERAGELRERVGTRARLAADRAGRAGDLRLDLAEGAVTMNADHFHHLADEILDNAFKFSQPGQPVGVVTRLTADLFTLTVTDQGCGMTPEQIANVSAYSQFNRAQREQQGSGLGLAIAQRLAALHGGTLELSPQNPAGTRVTVRLPAAAA